MFYLIVKIVSIVGTCFCLLSALIMSLLNPTECSLLHVSKNYILFYYLAAAFMSAFILGAFNEITSMMSSQRKRIMQEVRFSAKPVMWKIIAGGHFSIYLFFARPFFSRSSLDKYIMENILLSIYVFLSWAGVLSIVYAEDYYYQKRLKQEKELEPLKLY